MPQPIIHFKLTERGLAKLRDEQLPDELLKALEDIKNQEYQTTKALFKALHAIIDVEVVKPYRSRIETHARITKVLTPVGLSLFTNFFDEHKDLGALRQSYHQWKDLPVSSLPEAEREKLLHTKTRTLREDRDFKRFLNSSDISAEITSLQKIRHDVVEDEIHVYLLATDTLGSYCAATIIQAYFQNAALPIQVKAIRIVKNLRVDDTSKFEQIGLVELINDIDAITGGIFEKVIFNITGGYKAVIPYLTIMAQINKIPTYYIFEEMKDKSLIQIPFLPVQFDWALAEQYYPYLTKDVQVPISEQPLRDELQRQLQLIRQFDPLELTALGKMYKNYVDSELPVAKQTLGYFVEYKVLEYYLKQPDFMYKNFDRGVRWLLPGKDGAEGRELDIVFRRPEDQDFSVTDRQFVVIEVKSFLDLFDKKRFKDKTQSQIDKQVEGFLEISKTPQEYHLCIHLAPSQSSQMIESAISEICTLFKSKLPSCRFKVFFVMVDLTCEDPSKKEGYYKNLYQKFLDQRFNEKTFVAHPLNNQ